MVESRAEELFASLQSEGADEVRRLIDDREAENLFLDFKRSADNGSNKKLHQTDRDNLVKAISGFGNGSGGVILWGVDCSPSSGTGDLPSKEVPITDPKRFVSLLTGAISGCTLPPHTGVINHPIEFEGANDGFVATFVPASNTAPHQVIKRSLYYMRAGSDFVPVPHGILAGMFGRRPSASMKDNWAVRGVRVDGQKVRLDVGFSVRNVGQGIAHNFYISALPIQTVGPQCFFSFDYPKPEDWTITFTFERFISIVAKADNLLPPGAFTVPLGMTLIIEPPFESGFQLERVVGCEGSEPKRSEVKSTIRDIELAYEQSLTLEASSRLTEAKGYEIAAQILGIEQDFD